jgi:hypothetical protein
MRRNDPTQSRSLVWELRMPRFYVATPTFENWHERTVSASFPTLAEAAWQTLEIARSALAAAEAGGAQVDLHYSFVVVSETGELVAVVPFAAAVALQ